MRLNGSFDRQGGRGVGMLTRVMIMAIMIKAKFFKAKAGMAVSFSFLTNHGF